MREDGSSSRVFGNQDLDINLLTAFAQVLPFYRYAILANEQVVKGEDAHDTLLFACPVWFSNPTCLDALLAPTAERYVSACTVIFDLGSRWLARIGEDLMGSARLVRFFNVFAFSIHGSLSVFLHVSSMVAICLIVEQIFQVLLGQLSLQPSVGRKDHLT